MKKRLMSIALVLSICLLCLAGCSSNSEDTYTVYYLNIDKSVLVPKEYEVNSSKVDDIIEEMLGVLSTDTEYIKKRKRQAKKLTFLFYLMRIFPINKNKIVF